MASSRRAARGSRTAISASVKGATTPGSSSRTTRSSWPRWRRGSVTRSGSSPSRTGPDGRAIPRPDSPVTAFRIRPAASRTLDVAQARAVALDLLARKPWTRRDLDARLRRRGAPAEVAEAVVADLEARGYVDDRAFALTWAESRARDRSIGRQRLREELHARGIARPLAETAIARAFADTDELTRARDAGRRRLTVLRGRDRK